MQRLLKEIAVRFPDRSAWRKVLLSVAVLSVSSVILRTWSATFYDSSGYVDKTAQLMVGVLGLNFSLAFWSMWSQIAGLIGSRGIMPCSARMVELRARLDQHDRTEASDRDLADLTLPVLDNLPPSLPLSPSLCLCPLVVYADVRSRLCWWRTLPRPRP